mgnify:CR=1 FL=1
MKKNDAINTAIRELQQPPPMRNSDKFWNEFKARAAITPQTGTGTAAPRRKITWPRAVSIITGLAVLLVLAVLFLPRDGNHDTTQLSEVEEIDISVDYSGVMVMQDAQNGGTVVWVTDLNSEANM